MVVDGTRVVNATTMAERTAAAKKVMSITMTTAIKATVITSSQPMKVTRRTYSDQCTILLPSRHTVHNTDIRVFCTSSRTSSTNEANNTDKWTVKNRMDCLKFGEPYYSPSKLQRDGDILFVMRNSNTWCIKYCRTCYAPTTCL